MAASPSAFDEVRRLASQCKCPAPATLGELQEFESRSGLRLPSVLRELYLTVGNGGWGPPRNGDGLYGLITGHRDDLGNSALDMYLTFLGDSTDDPWWKWTPGVLPLCHWGCAIQSCIDCRSSEGPVLRFDPHLLDPDNNKFVEAALVPERLSTTEWLSDWALGRLTIQLDGTSTPPR